jgi:hypothetical protein
VAKMALIQRELKRDQLAAKYAKKYAEFKAIAGDFKRTDEERAAARLGCKSSHAIPTQPASVTVVPSLVVLAERSSTLAWRAPRFVKWPLLGKSLASSRPAGKRQENQT